MAERIVSYLEGEGKMNPNQHGFRRNRSCLSELVQHHYCALQIVEENKCADVIYLDFFEGVREGGSWCVALESFSGWNQRTDIQMDLRIPSGQNAKSNYFWVRIKIRVGQK